MVAKKETDKKKVVINNHLKRGLKTFYIWHINETIKYVCLKTKLTRKKNVNLNDL